MSELLSRLIILVAGTLYPAYRSYKAVRTKDVREYVKWMMYWIVFAVFCLAETVADTLLSFWFPFYYYVKIVFVVWLLSPWTKGSSILYRKWIHPTLAKHEKDIDAMLDQAKSESYNQMVRLGSRGLMCARDIVATAALRGQEQLVQQIQRSYSMSDVGREEPRKRAEVTGIVEMDEPGSDDERRGGGRARSMGYPAAAAGDSRAESENRDIRRSSRSRSRSRQSTYGDDSIGEYHSATMPLRRNPRRY